METRDNKLLRLIAVFKLIKAVTLVVVGVGALHLLRDNNVADSFSHLAARFGLNPGSRYLDRALAKIVNLPQKDFRELGIGSFIYAALFLTEGIGLWFAKPWAEWFTTIITASLVPLEIYEIYRHATIAKVIVLLLNLTVVIYLALRIRKERSTSN
jgi:uncharacterized membrane protein (DUF2068 family)